MTTDWVFVETLALTASRRGRGAALRLGRALSDSGVVTVHALDADLRLKAWTRYEASSSLSLVDCGSFSAMDHLHVARAFAFDRDFADAGFALETC